MQKILIIEDDEKLRNELEIFLNNNGYQAESLKTFDNTINDIFKINPNLILLDINLPGVNGEYVCKEIRKQSNMGIIIVTSKDNELDELISINYGADHYITKPFNIQILLAKIGSLLRRTNNNETKYKIDARDFILNISNSTIEKDNKIIELTKNEYKILRPPQQARGRRRRPGLPLPEGRPAAGPGLSGPRSAAVHPGQPGLSGLGPRVCGAYARCPSRPDAAAGRRLRRGHPVLRRPRWDGRLTSRPATRRSCAGPRNG